MFFKYKRVIIVDVHNDYRVRYRQACTFFEHDGIRRRLSKVASNILFLFDASRRIKKKENIASYFAQASAYAIMFEERTGLAIPNTVIVMDVDDNHPLIFEEHRDNFVELLLSTKKEYDRRKLFSH